MRCSLCRPLVRGSSVPCFRRTRYWPDVRRSRHCLSVSRWACLKSKPSLSDLQNQCKYRRLQKAYQGWRSTPTSGQKNIPAATFVEAAVLQQPMDTAIWHTASRSVTGQVPGDYTWLNRKPSKIGGHLVSGQVLQRRCCASACLGS